MQRPASLRSEGGRNGVDQVAGIAWTDRPNSVEYALRALREHLDQTLDRLALPGTDLVRMDLVLRGDLLKRPVAPKRLQRNLHLQPPPENRRRLLLICIPPSDGGIHLSDLPDFPGSPHCDIQIMSIRAKMCPNQDD